MRKSFEEYKGSLLQALQTANWADVVIHATEMLKLEDNHPWLWANRGVALNRLGHPFDAILNYDRALALEESAISLNNKGAAYQDMDNFDKSLECFERALQLDPNIAQTHMNFGNAYKWLQRDALALQAYRKCVETDPSYVDGHLALAFMLLRMGKLEEGWKEFEWRWKSTQLPPRGLKQPQWAGEDLNGKNILVYAEQGLGDTIQFARYARILALRYPRCRVIVEGKQPLKRLLETLPNIYAVLNFGEPLPVVDYVVPMLTLAGMLTPYMGSIPSDSTQYFLKSNDIAVWRNNFAKLPDGFRVGICWAGMSRIENPVAAKIDEARSMSLTDFAPLARIPGIVWVSLQKGPPAQQVKAPPLGMTIVDYAEDLIDFYETCCVIENCDLVITVDTAVAHAAASIGKPTWMLSRWDGCWRWFGPRQDSPWYPSLRQFVQLRPHDWDGVVEQMAVELAEEVKDQTQPKLNLTMAN